MCEERSTPYLNSLSVVITIKREQDDPAGLKDQCFIKSYTPNTRRIDGNFFEGSKVTTTAFKEVQGFFMSFRTKMIRLQYLFEGTTV